MKLIEEQKAEQEKKLNLFSDYIIELVDLLEKNKLLLNFSKKNFISITK